MADKVPTTESGGIVRTTLTAVKETRKRAELDAQLLANRIALLKQEEDKAERKIEDTKKRANEILALRSENEGKFQMKELHYKDKWEGIRQCQVQNSYRRDQLKSAREANLQAIRESKRQQVNQMKLKKSDNLLAKKERESNHRIINVDRTNQIRQQKESAKQRQEMERMRKLDAYRQEYEERVAKEEELRQRTEVLVTKMEKEEMDLIQRLQNTQALQRSAYEDLENALNGSQLSRSNMAAMNRESQRDKPMMLKNGESAQRPAA